MIQIGLRDIDALTSESLYDFILSIFDRLYFLLLFGFLFHLKFLCESFGDGSGFPWSHWDVEGLDLFVAEVCEGFLLGQILSLLESALLLLLKFLKLLQLFVLLFTKEAHLIGVIRDVRKIELIISTICFFGLLLCFFLSQLLLFHLLKLCGLLLCLHLVSGELLGNSSFFCSFLCFLFISRVLIEDLLEVLFRCLNRILLNLLSLLLIALLLCVCLGNLVKKSLGESLGPRLDAVGTVDHHMSDDEDHDYRPI